MNAKEIVDYYKSRIFSNSDKDIPYTRAKEWLERCEHPSMAYSTYVAEKNIRAFMSMNRVKPSKSNRRCEHWLEKGRCSVRDCAGYTGHGGQVMRPLWDHVDSWIRDKNVRCYTTQPYHLFHETLTATMAWVQKKGFWIRISTHGWHYATHCQLIEVWNVDPENE